MYITSGTHNFMKKLWLKQQLKVQIFQNAEESILIHETKNKSVFASPRKYEVIYSTGEIKSDTPLTSASFYVDKREYPLFIERFKRHIHEIYKPRNMIGLRLLKPINTAHFCVIISWHSLIGSHFDIASLVGKNHVNFFVSRKFSKKYFPIEGKYKLNF